MIHIKKIFKKNRIQAESLCGSCKPNSFYLYCYVVETAEGGWARKSKMPHSFGPPLTFKYRFYELSV